MEKLDHPSSRLEYVRRFLSPPIFPDDENKTRLAYRLNAMCLVGMLIMMIYLLIWLIVLPDKAYWLIFGIPIFSLLGIVIFLIRSDHVQFASNLFLSSTWIIITFISLSVGGTRAPFFGFYSIVVFSAVVLSGWNTALFYGVLTFITGSVMTYLANTGQITEPIATPMTAWLTQTAIMVFVTMLGYIVFHDMKHALEQAQNALAERKQAEGALREGEKRYRVVNEMISDYAYAYQIHADNTFTPIWITDESFERLTEYTWDEIGASYKLYHPEDVERVIQHVDQTIKGQPLSGEYRIVTRSGEIRWIYVRRLLEIDEQTQRPIRFYGSAEDITERKRAELDLQLSEQRYRGAITAAGLVPYVIEYREKRFSFIGSDIFKLTGYTSQEISPALLRESILEEYMWKNIDKSPQEARLQVQAGMAMEWQNDFRILTRKGERRWISDASVPIVDESGKAVGAIGILQDITDRKQAENEIRVLNVELNEKATQLGVLNDISRDISALTDLTSTLKLVLAKLQATLSLDMFFVALHHPETGMLTFPLMYDSGHIWNEGPNTINPSFSISQVLQSGKPILINRTPEQIQAGTSLDQRLGDMSRVSASIIIAPLPLGQTNIGVISIQSYTLNHYKEKHIEMLMAAAYQIAIAIQNARLYDSVQNELTERKRLEAELQGYANTLEKLVEERTNALRRAKEQFELILNNTTNALAFADPNGNVLVTNPAFRSTFMEANSQSIEFILQSFATDEQIVLAGDALLKVIHDKESQRIEVRIISKSGITKDVDLTFIPVNISDTETRNGVLLSGHDITQMKEIERFKARFVADAVHDLATPIAGLSARMYLLKRTPEKLTDHVRALENQVTHLRNLLGDLRILSQIDRGQMAFTLEPCSVNILVQRVFDTYEPVALDKHQSFTQSIDPSLPDILLDPNQIERMLVNLVSNAINYTASHKAISIETALEGQDVVIRVSDQGIGISSEDMEHIFERFYRAPEARENLSSGTGLGLAITKEIVELHKGSITINTEQGKGSTFIVRLPLHT